MTGTADFGATPANPYASPKVQPEPVIRKLGPIAFGRGFVNGGGTWLLSLVVLGYVHNYGPESCRDLATFASFPGFVVEPPKSLWGFGAAFASGLLLHMAAWTAVASGWRAWLRHQYHCC